MNHGLRIFVIFSSLLLVTCLFYTDKLIANSGQWIRIQSGVASWYGMEEQDKVTANGERFDRHKLTAASRKLPFNTFVRVINLKNGRSVEVRINDRGPYVSGRVIDLSEAAATVLDMKKSGVAPVEIDVSPLTASEEAPYSQH